MLDFLFVFFVFVVMWSQFENKDFTHSRFYLFYQSLGYHVFSLHSWPVGFPLKRKNNGVKEALGWTWAELGVVSTLNCLGSMLV